MNSRCSFNNSPCNPEEIETFAEVTDRCFTFNPDKRNPIRSTGTCSVGVYVGVCDACRCVCILVCIHVCVCACIPGIFACVTVRCLK